MAMVNITPVELDEMNKASAEITTSALTTAIDGTNGACYEHRERDDKYLVIAQNTHASASKTLTVKKGNGIQGVIDKAFPIAAGKTIYFCLESGFFKNVSGENKGKVIFAGDADIKVAVVKLP